MRDIENLIIEEAVRLKGVGLSRDEAYGWAKRWHFVNYDYSSSAAQYDEFVDALSEALNR